MIGTYLRFQLRNTFFLLIPDPQYSCFKRGLHEADSFVRSPPTAEAAGYSATAPTGLASSAAARYTP